MERARLGFVAAVLASLAAVPALAIVESPATAEPGLRPALVHVDPPLMPSSPGPLPGESPHDAGGPPRNDGERRIGGPRIDLPDRHDMLLEDLRDERSSRSTDGSPRLKDLDAGGDRDHRSDAPHLDRPDRHDAAFDAPRDERDGAAGSDRVTPDREVDSGPDRH